MSQIAKNCEISFNFIIEQKFSVFLGALPFLGSANTKIEQYKEGGRNDYVQKPTVTKYQNLVLKRGLTASNTLYDWEKEVARGKISPKNISVILLDSQGREAKRWDFKEAFPLKWSSGNLNSTGSSIEIETLELAHKGLVL